MANQFSRVNILRIGKYCSTNLIAATMLAFTVNAWADDVNNHLANVSLTHPMTSMSELEFDFSQTPDFHYSALANPTRLVVNLKNTDLTAKIAPIVWDNTPVTKMLFERKDDNTLQVTLNFSVLAPKLRVQQIDSSLEHKLIIDMDNIQGASNKPSNQQTFENVNAELAKQSTAQTDDVNTEIDKLIASKATISNAKPSTTAAVTTTTSTPPKTVITAAPSKTKHDIVVVIDPGHGGKDPGAEGQHGEREKDVTLGISEQLYRILNQAPGIHPILTRSGDYYLTLRQRLDMARDANADVFIAVHADAYDNPYSHGASVYALSLKGASSEAARWLAEKENYSELGGVDLNGKGDMLRSVLIDLSQTATISSSLVLGQDILQDLGQLGALHHGDKVEQAPFVVLKSPDIPSVLVETGFISNPDEAKHLENTAYEQAVANAIAEGLNQYFHESPQVLG